MSPRVLLRLGVRSLLLHKLRSSLSILGVASSEWRRWFIVFARRKGRRESWSRSPVSIDSITVRGRPAAAERRPGRA
jgi:hypothetical protein